MSVLLGVAHCDHVSVYAEDEGRESPPEAGGFQFPSWLSKDDFITVTVALSISYGIRWHVLVPPSTPPAPPQHS